MQLTCYSNNLTSKKRRIVTVADGLPTDVSVEMNTAVTLYVNRLGVRCPLEAETQYLMGK